MQELLEQIDGWLARGERVAVATVVRTMGSSPRQVGAKMARHLETLASQA